MNFKNFAQQVKSNFDSMSTKPLYRTNVDLDEIKEVYLAAFPAGSNPMYITNTTHDCTCCKSFIRNVGGLVNIVNGQIITIWDNINTGDEYEVVANTMRDYVLSKSISSVFYASEKKYGAYESKQTLPDGSVINWNHFNCEIPNHLFKGDKVGELAGQHTTSASMLSEAVQNFTQEAVNSVIDLINAGQLYRGEEHLEALLRFNTLAQMYGTYENNAKLFGLEHFNNPSARFKNTVIGTLVEDLSKGVDLEIAVKSFESKVAPANYKRNKSLITQGMINTAMETINDLGIEPALSRRHATIHDININDVLWADRTAAQKMQGVANLLASAVAKKKPSTDKVAEVSIDTFLNDLVPTAESIEVLVENKHQSNFMNILAPAEPSAPNIMKWDNNFTWSYNGNVTDSMKETVKAFGGKIDGAMRFSIMWNENNDNPDDLDAHCKSPFGEIYYGNKSIKNLHLDVDIVSPKGVAVENITYNSTKILPGTYRFFVNNYSARGATSGFKAELEINGEVYEYVYPKPLNIKQNVDVVSVTIDSNGIVTISHKLPHGQSSKSVYGIDTNQFTKVNSIMLSPNHWENTVPTGNKHFMFILDNCATKDTVRGFYNEFLSNELTPHRKVFEILADKMKVQPDSEQLAGIAFSSTARNDLVVKLTTSTSVRTYKIIF